jgi:hypothetical protein
MYTHWPADRVSISELGLLAALHLDFSRDSPHNSAKNNQNDVDLDG